MSCPRIPFRRQYQPSLLDDVENLEQYRAGGFYPVHLGDTFDDGRYKVLHKLGYGGFSTVWLARDTAAEKQVALKILTADASTAYECPELRLAEWLHGDEASSSPAGVEGLANGAADSERSGTTDDAYLRCGHAHVTFPQAHFTVEGINGTHVCLVLELAGPSISQLLALRPSVLDDVLVRSTWPQRARNLAKQAADVLAYLHSRGIVHGGQYNAHAFIFLVLFASPPPF
jgi:serine/threonine protein kinase